MDGASYDIFERGWTPFISKMLQRGENFKPINDLMSRGWIEIASGKHGIKTGALYDFPKCDGSYNWSTEYSLSLRKQYDTAGEWFWNHFNNRGSTVGVLNLPTTFPAPEVKGFFISGGGGGAPVVSAPTEELVYPKNILKTLLEKGYIVDERISQLVLDEGVKNVSQIIERLKIKNQRRVETLIKLVKDNPINIGFITFKTSSVMVETLIQMDLQKKKIGEKYDTHLIEAMKDYYEHFDNLVKMLVNDIDPNSIILISDHGMTPTQYKFNPNKVLQNLKFQKIRGLNTSKRKAQRIARKLIPVRIKRFLKKTLSNQIGSVTPIFFDPNNTIAFCRTFGDWRSGIYINDNFRFKGPIEYQNIRLVANGVCAEMNKILKNYPTYVRAKISVKDGNSKGSKQFPDIIFEAADGILFDDKIDYELIKYECPKKYDALKGLLQTQMSAVKSSTPVFSVIHKSMQNIGPISSLTQFSEVIEKLLIGQKK